MLNIRREVFNAYQENTYIISLGDAPEAVIVDPGCASNEERDRLLKRLADAGLKPAAVLLTHAHPDHIGGVKTLQERYGVKTYMCEAERTVFSLDFPTTAVEDGQTITAGGIEFEVITTPGHTPGGVCWLARKYGALFTGDTLFAGSIGRTDFLYSEYDDEIRSIMEKIILLDPDIRIFPGHGPTSTIGQERTGNPFLEPFNEPEETTDPDLEPVVIHGE